MACKAHVIKFNENNGGDKNNGFAREDKTGRKCSNQSISDQSSKVK